MLKLFLDQKTALTLGGESKAPAKIGDPPTIKDDCEDYEAACERIRKDNEELLEGFVAMLRSGRLASRTIGTHRDNVDFFINEFLLRVDLIKPSDGIGMVDEFLGDWFIRKAMWSTSRAIKSTATSLHKFYIFLALSGKVSPAELAALKQTILVRLPQWQAMCERYNDGKIEDWRGLD